MLEHLPDNVPYELELNVGHWEIDDMDRLNILINIIPAGKKSSPKRQLVSFLFLITLPLKSF